MKLINEKSIMSDNKFIKEEYRFDQFLQIVLTSVNGLTLKKDESNSIGKSGAILDQNSSILKRNEIPIANLYLKFAHFDKNH